MNEENNEDDEEKENLGVILATPAPSNKVISCFMIILFKKFAIGFLEINSLYITSMSVKIMKKAILGQMNF